MTMWDKIKAFFKWYGKGMEFSEAKPEVKGAEKKEAEPSEAKVAKAPEKKEDESSPK